MRFMTMHKTDARTEAGWMPPPEFIAAVGSLVGEMIQSGVFSDAAGMRPSSHGVRLRFADGTRTVTNGPFAGDNELIAGYHIVRVPSMDHAIDWASRYAAIVGDTDIDIRPVTEPWDLGVAPKPDGNPAPRYMLVHKADARYEAGIVKSAEVKAALKKLYDETRDAGVLLSHENVKPGAQSKRMRFKDGKRTVIDGPFAESKELIGGFCTVNVDRVDDAIEWASRMARILGDVEMDIRPIDE